MSLARSFQVFCINPHVCGPLLRTFGLEKSGLKTTLSHVKAGTQQGLSEDHSHDFLNPMIYYTSYLHFFQ